VEIGIVDRSGLDWLFGQVQSLGDFIFYQTILDYLRDEIQKFAIELLGNAMEWVGGVALTLMTVWIMVQGYRIATGRSRDSMMLLVTNSLKATLILTIATGMSMFGSDLHEFLLVDVKEDINWVVTGEREAPEAGIDRNLAWMQVALTSIDALDVAGDPTIDNAKSRALWFTGLGAGGPALVGGTMLLLYEVALALFIGLGPLFVLSLLFEQTRSLFSKWLYYGIGTMFSMAVLSAMVSIALEMVVRVSAAFWASALTGALLGANFTEGITSQAMQQGGMGLILTALIISAPPMAAAFFNGTMGSFVPYAQMNSNVASGQVNALPGPAGQPPGSYAVDNRNAHALGQQSHPGSSPMVDMRAALGSPTSSGSSGDTVKKSQLVGPRD
jgi:type IV secretion system protein VirB6